MLYKRTEMCKLKPFSPAGHTQCFIAEQGVVGSAARRPGGRLVVSSRHPTSRAESLLC